jgi:hypothetical protein
VIQTTCGPSRNVGCGTSLLLNMDSSAAPSMSVSLHGALRYFHYFSLLIVWENSRPNGLPLRDPNHIRIWVGPGENPRDFLDEYGQ